MPTEFECELLVCLSYIYDYDYEIYLKTERLCVVTNGGELYHFQLESDISPEETDFERLLADDHIDPTNLLNEVERSDELLVNRPISADILQNLWDLTLSEGDGCSAGYQVQVPSSWSEVQQQYRLRKSPQYHLRDDRIMKTWHLIPNK